MRIVIALGGNALGETPEQQKRMVELSSKLLLPLIKEGHEIVFTHGNGPQVGLINDAFATSHKINEKISEMPFVECGAMTQGYIGYHLQNALMNELRLNNIHKQVVTIVTEVLVDENDPAWNNPTKPVGVYMTKEEASLKSYPSKEMPNGKGYRRVVASPLPIEIIEKDIIDSLLKQNNIIIACGGGGIPVINKNNQLIGVDAVIDKDYVSECLATSIQADLLVILTAVENVYLNYREENQVTLSKISYQEIKEYIQYDQFKAGSMLPKVEACLNFVEHNKKANSIITSIEKVAEALNNDNIGTHIYYK